jgi:hypothetical protein
MGFLILRSPGKRILQGQKLQGKIVKARKDNKLGSSVSSDIGKIVLSTAWNLKTNEAASFLWRTLSEWILAAHSRSKIRRDIRTCSVKNNGNADCILPI